MVTMGRVVVTMDASMGEVMDRPKMYTPWLNTNAKSVAKNTIKKAGEKKEFLTAFLTYEKHQRAFEAVKKELCHLLHVLKPKKLQANVTFGFSDPSWTGYMLAFLGSIYGLIGECVQIQPDFEERKLEGNASAEGKIRVIYFAVPAWKLFWNKDVKITYKHIRKYIK